MDYPSNSHLPPEPPKKTAREPLKPVVTGRVLRRKKPLGKRFREIFTRGDASGVLSYVILDVLIPAAKDMAADATSMGMERALFGDARGRTRGRASSGGRYGTNYTSYNRYSGPGTPMRDEPRQMTQRGRANHEFNEVILPSKAEAEEVIDRLIELVQQYEMAKVSDLYELIGISSNYTDDKWGWTNLDSANVRRIREGYVLDLPRPISLD